MSIVQMHGDKYDELLESCRTHMRFLIALYWKQIENEAFFAHEAPDPSSQWYEKEMLELLGHPHSGIRHV